MRLSFLKNTKNLLFIAFYLGSILISPCFSQSLIRDAELENELKTIIDPLLMASYGNTSTISLYVIADPNFNAFVQDGQKIFIHTGLILNTKTPEQLAGVLAHEMGHIQGGHLLKGTEAQSNAGVTSLLTGAAIGVVAALSGGDGGSALAGGLLAGSQAGLGSMMSFTRTQEAAADQAALVLLNKSGISTKGLYQTMEFLSKQEYGAGDYMRSHPLSRERIDLLKNQEKLDRGIPDTVKKISLDKHRYERIQAKLAGFLENPTYIKDKYQNLSKDNDLYVIATASALHKEGNGRQAYNILKDYLLNNPDDGYMHDLAGQIAIETGLTNEACEHYRKASELIPNNQLINLAYASSIIATENNVMLPRAVSLLKEALRSERNYAKGYWDLSIAYDRLGDNGKAAAASARYNQLLGRDDLAIRHAQRAIADLDPHSAEFLQTKDILHFLQEKRKQK